MCVVDWYIEYYKCSSHEKLVSQTHKEHIKNWENETKILWNYAENIDEKVAVV